MVHKMKTLEEVLYDYTRGEKTLEEANKALKELGCGLTLDPTRNLFSARELLETRAGETPDEANGWGILDHSVGSLEKVHVVNVVHGRKLRRGPRGSASDAPRLPALRQADAYRVRNGNGWNLNDKNTDKNRKTKE